MTSMYDADFLQAGSHNYEPLTPISFLKRSRLVHPNRTAIIHGHLHFTYEQFYTRSVSLASTLHSRFSIGYGCTVAALLPNTPAMLELHNAVPMTGGVLNAINTRLDPASIAYIVQHGESSIFFVDSEFTSLALHALEVMKKTYPRQSSPCDYRCARSSPSR